MTTARRRATPPIIHAKIEPLNTNSTITASTNPKTIGPNIKNDNESLLSVSDILDPHFGHFLRIKIILSL